MGRRVLVATRQEWACGNACFNGVTRTVWDGDQVLHELRAPFVDPSFGVAHAEERDTGQAPVGTQSAPLYGQDKDAPRRSFPMVPEDEQQYLDTYMGAPDPRAFP